MAERHLTTDNNQMKIQFLKQLTFYDLPPKYVIMELGNPIVFRVQFRQTSLKSFQKQATG